MSGTPKKSKSLVPMYAAALIGVAVYSVATYVVVEVAGGTTVSSVDSNTPNAVAPGPLPAK